MRLLFIITALFSFTLLSTCGRAEEKNGMLAGVKNPERPNILWLTCEDISPMLAAFGDSTARTPNLDKLAARGVRFPNTFSVAGVCAPSRCGIATGMYPISIGGLHMRNQNSKQRLIDLGLPGNYDAMPPPEVKMMSQVMRENGYWATNNSKTDYQFEPVKAGWDELGNQAHWRRRPDPEMPFFSIFNMEVTHESQVWQTTKKALRIFPGFEKEGVDTKQWLGFITDEDKRPAITVDPATVPVPPYLVDDAATRKDLARVYSNIEILDEQIGVLLTQLEEDGLAENTIIFFYSDHGGPLPRGKRLLFDSGLRVPMMVAWPDERMAGKIDSTLVSFVDLAPTVFSLAGIEVPDYLQGQVYLGPEKAAARKYVFGAVDRLDSYYDRRRAVRDDRFKLIRNYYPERPQYVPVKYREQLPSMQSLLAGNAAGTLTDAQARWFKKTKPSEELYDTKTDPFELKNLADDPSYQEKLVELRTAMDNWLNEVGDLGELSEIEMVQQFWDGSDTRPVTGRPQLRRDSLGRFLLESKTPGANIAYQITPAGKTPGRWQVYHEPIDYVRGDTLRAVAQRIGYAESGVSEGW